MKNSQENTQKKSYSQLRKENKRLKQQNSELQSNVNFLRKQEEWAGETLVFKVYRDKDSSHTSHPGRNVTTFELKQALQLLLMEIKDDKRRPIDISQFLEILQIQSNFAKNEKAVINEYLQSIS